jgi:SM-20-related protein
MKLAIESWQRARDHFAFFYDSHRLSEDGEAYARPTHTFAGLVSILKAPDFLRFIRSVTGMEIALADAEATLFRPGDYLTRQDGTAQGKNRVAGYVLSMTRAWRLDWGGALEFIGDAGHIDKGYVPTFNTLTVFQVPRLHFVSQVALHGGLRYAVSGWLRSVRP